MIENDMVEQVQRFDALTECGQQIVQYVDNETAVLKISTQLEGFQERWEKLVQQMETHSKKVSQISCSEILFWFESTVEKKVKISYNKKKSNKWIKSKKKRWRSQSKFF